MSSLFCRHEVVVDTGCGACVIDMTDRVSSVLRECGAGNGLVLIYSPHTTSAVIVNEAEPGLMEDIVNVLRRVIPGKGWKHDRVDNNAWSHLGASLLGPSVVLTVERGRPVLGTWQRILFVELDGPRRRRLGVSYMGFD